MNVVIVHREELTEVHLETCKSKSRKLKGSFETPVIVKVTTPEELEKNFLVYTDDDAMIVHACARQYFTKSYLTNTRY